MTKIENLSVKSCPRTDPCRAVAFFWPFLLIVFLFFKNGTARRGTARTSSTPCPPSVKITARHGRTNYGTDGLNNTVIRYDRPNLT